MRDDKTIAGAILYETARMRKAALPETPFENATLCWGAEELERLAMFAVDAKNKLGGSPAGASPPERQAVPASVYESAVQGRQEFRRALVETRQSVAQARDFIASLVEWPEAYFSDRKWWRAWQIAAQNELERLDGAGI